MDSLFFFKVVQRQLQLLSLSYESSHLPACHMLLTTMEMQRLGTWPANPLGMHRISKPKKERLSKTQDFPRHNAPLSPFPKKGKFLFCNNFRLTDKLQRWYKNPCLKLVVGYQGGQVAGRDEWGGLVSAHAHCGIWNHWSTGT